MIVKGLEQSLARTRFSNTTIKVTVNMNAVLAICTDMIVPRTQWKDAEYCYM